MCHDNCDELFEQKKIKQVIFGYALSSDSIFRSHS